MSLRSTHMTESGTIALHVAHKVRFYIITEHKSTNADYIAVKHGFI